MDPLPLYPYCFQCPNGKTLEIHPLTEVDVEEAALLVCNSYCQKNPLYAHAGCDFEDSIKWAQNGAKLGVKEKLGIVCKDPTNKNLIVGVIIPFDFYTSGCSKPLFKEAFENVWEFCDGFVPPFNVTKSYEAVTFSKASVHTDYEKQGIFTQMAVFLMEKHEIGKNVKYWYADCTTPFSEKSLIKLGFKTVLVKHPRDFITKKGTTPFKDIDTTVEKLGMKDFYKGNVYLIKEI